MGDPRFVPTVAVFSGGGTGGHLYPALALSEALQAVRPDLKVFFVGARRGIEARILPERGVDHLLLPVRGFRRGRILENLAVTWALLRSLVAVGQLFSRLRPGLVVATGGYASGPAGLAAVIMGVPLVLQEQNARPGFTTRMLSPWARRTHLAFSAAREFLPARAHSRARLSGNPIRSPEEADTAGARARFDLGTLDPVILVVGGSQGAEALNRSVLEMVTLMEEGAVKRPPGLGLIWATGPSHLDRVTAGLEALGNPSWIRAMGYIHHMPEALSVTTVAVSRSGAMMTAELLAWGVPAVLVPLPTAAADHQTRNAESLEAAGAAVHLPETELDGSTLWTATGSLLQDPDALGAAQEAARRMGRPEAALEIARDLASFLPPPTPAPGSPEGRASS